MYSVFGITALPLLIYLFPFVTEPRHGSEGTMLSNNMVSMRLGISRAWQLVRKWTAACVSVVTEAGLAGKGKKKKDGHAASVQPRDVGGKGEDADQEKSSLSSSSSSTPMGTSSSSSSSSSPSSAHAKDHEANKALLQDDSTMMGPLTVVHLFFFLLVLIITDVIGPGEHRFYWGLLYLLLPTQLLVLYSEDGLKITHSFSYCMFYSVVLMRQPDFLGHVVMHYFKDMQATSDEVAFHSHGRLTLQSYKVRVLTRRGRAKRSIELKS